jgi:DNA processing protein
LPQSPMPVEMVELDRRDPGFPEHLEKLTDTPERLFVIGKLPLAPMVAVVGSRDADRGMIRYTAALAGDLVARGLVVLSGGAAGIDTAAHRGALEAGGTTVAIIGSGFDHMYPPANWELFGKIALSGALVSEFEPNTPPTRWTFPKRNRLVAAMAAAVVVIQASERSGALITARIARGLKVPVGAVPGSVNESRSKGANGLIRGGAALIEDASDVMRLVDGSGSTGQLNLPEMNSRGKETASAAPIPAGISENEALVFDVLGDTPMHIDDVAATIGLGASETGASLMSLELLGFVEDRGGKYFVRSTG